MMRQATAFLMAGLAIQFVTYPDEAQAAEGGLGFYLLGSKTSLAGFVPPPGPTLRTTTTSTPEARTSISISAVSTSMAVSTPTLTSNC